MLSGRKIGSPLTSSHLAQYGQVAVIIIESLIQNSHVWPAALNKSDRTGDSQSIYGIKLLSSDNGAW